MQIRLNCEGWVEQARSYFRRIICVLRFFRENRVMFVFSYEYSEFRFFMMNLQLLINVYGNKMSWRTLQRLPSNAHKKLEASSVCTYYSHREQKDDFWITYYSQKDLLRFLRIHFLHIHRIPCFSSNYNSLQLLSAFYIPLKPMFLGSMICEGISIELVSRWRYEGDIKNAQKIIVA